MERLTHYDYTDANGFTLSVDDQEKANIELARYENIGIEPGELAWMMDDYKAMKDAEEQGRLIEFPVSIGNHIWVIVNTSIIETVVTSIVIDRYGARIKTGGEGTYAYDTILNAEYLGTLFFKTKEEAEEKIKELK